MKKMTFFILFFLTNFLYSQDDNIFQYYLKNGELKYLDILINSLKSGNGDFFWVINVLDKSDSRLVRNTIFAKHGYKFNSIDLQKEFSRFSWYKGVKTNVDNELTEEEWDVIKYLQKFEENYPTNVPKELIGCWWYDVPVDWWKHSPHGYENHSKILRFYKNGTFTFKNYNDLEGYQYDGLWSFNEGKIILKFLFIYIGFQYDENGKWVYDSKINRHYFFDPNIHHDKFTKSFLENITFYNKHINGDDEEVWECNFQKDFHSWKKISKWPDYYVPDH